MGAPAPEMNAENAADDSAAQNFVSSLRTISAPERRKHASVYNYWLSIKRDRHFPPIRDLDPLELSDAAPFSLLLEMIGGGEDAEVRHIGHAIKNGIQVEKICEAPNPSLLSCIATRLPVVAACRDAFAFEDEFETADGKTRLWVTLLPFSATGSWIDYVYGFVSIESPSGTVEAVTMDEIDEVAEEPVEELVESGETVEEVAEEASPVEPTDVEANPSPEIVEAELEEPETFSQTAEDHPDSIKPTFSEKFFEKLSNIGGFYGRPVEIELDPESVSLETWETDEKPLSIELPEPEEVSATDESVDEPMMVEQPVEELPPADEPVMAESPMQEPVPADEPIEPEPPAEELSPADPPAPADEPMELEPSAKELSPADEPAPTHEPSTHLEGTLESKLTDVRAKADEARQAKLRANAALYEGLSAAYDFALDAEDSPEEYLKLVQAEGLKIQLRSPMRPVAKLAFDGMCDDMTIKQLEAILAWAFDEELPRGKLAERIEEEGGIAPILNRQAKAA